MTKDAKYLSIKNKMILLGIGVAVFYWFLESIIHAFIFQDGGFIEQIFPSKANELWMRLVTACLFVGFGIYARSATNKLMKMSEKLHASNQQLQATEQQLKAANQQLTAHEQQLRAANQQLNASNQQLRASNQQLQDSEDRFRDFFENAPIGFHIFGPDRIITRINEAELAIIGYARDEIVGKKTLADLIIAEHKDQFEKHWRDIITNGEVRDLEYTLVHKDGHHIDVILNASSRFDKQGNLINTRGSVSDITKRKQAENELVAANQQLEAANEQLQASEQQLRAANQQLKATNQQLQASEQQLRAANQQLEAANEQLQASEQQLKAANQQLRASQEKIQALARFPSENPNPVLRISADGTILYANEASSPVLETWECKRGQRLPEDCYKWVEEALNSGEVRTFEFNCLNGQIFSTTLAPVVAAGYVNAYGLDITERKDAEKNLFDYQQQLKSLASQLTLTEERERHRLATELHASIGQTLAVSKLKLDAICASAPSGDLARTLNEVCNSLDETIQEARSLTFDLSFPILYELGFEAAVAAWLTEQIQEKHGIKTEFEDDKEPIPLDEDVKVFLFRDVRELLLNVAKHAQAHKVKVSIRKVDRQIHIIVEDDGVGFEEVKSRSASAGGFGLFSIRERLGQLGGRLEIESKPGLGTKVTIFAPLKSDTDELDAVVE